MISFAATWLGEVEGIARRIKTEPIEEIVHRFKRVRRDNGRIFVLGLGGSSANASHCVNDLRTRARIEAYAPTDAVPELLARCNDERDGWSNMFARWLEGSNLSRYDLVLLFSVSGASQPLVTAAKYARTRSAKTVAIVGTAMSVLDVLTDTSLVIPCPKEAHRAGHAEAFQAVVWHLIVSHPELI